MKAPLFYDVETTTHMKGNPFSIYNKAVLWGFRSDEIGVVLIWQHEPDAAERIQKILEQHELLVGANIKFDIHWLLRYNISIDGMKLWDLLLFHYAELYQKKKYVSLDDCAEAYGFSKKLDVVKTQYWDKGIDTDQIPPEVLEEYLGRDLELTEQCFWHQWELRKQYEWFTTFRLDCLDLLTAIEMEQNGVLCDVEGVSVELERQKARKAGLEHAVKSVLCPNLDVNLGSGQQLSVLLYGGVITEEVRVPIGVFKSGQRIGQPRYSVLRNQYEFPQMFKPPPRSELATSKKDPEGNIVCQYYKTDIDTLRSIKCNKKSKEILEQLIEISQLEKLIGSYLEKYPRIIAEYGWKDSYIHGTFNAGVTITARLASEKPNLQNTHPVMQQYFVSRYSS
jgi:DNA polymerase I-like protein with 3'-5' exonuclease and polymerase domains